MGKSRASAPALSAGNTKFNFDDAYPFQRLFCAVVEFEGFDGKAAATSYSMPELPVLDDDCDGEEEV